MNKIIIGIILCIIIYIGIIFNFLDVIVSIALIIGLYELIKNETNNTKSNNYNSSSLYYILFSISIIIIVSIVFMINNDIIKVKDIIFVGFVVCVSDIFQELVGKSLKITKGYKNKIGWISPNKTYEGYIGGYIGILILCFSLYKNKFILLNIIYLLGIFGDLFFSYIKRMLDIKDYSNILLSHGGILDRFDSFIFAILIYSLLSYSKR